MMQKQEGPDTSWAKSAWYFCYPEVGFSVWLFLRFLGAIFLIAFVSLWTQIIGLAGRNGALSAAAFLSAVRESLGLARYALLPTLCWIQTGDGMLHGLCGLGVCASVLLIADVAPVASLGVLWAVYLSLATVCRDFLWFQWDSLLLEAGFVAIFLAPLRWRPKTEDAPPSRLAVWMARWLLFRLIFSSGVVKLTSGDPTWRHLTALTYHYETQPLPTWIGWYAHQLPRWCHVVSCAATLAIEIIVPWLIWVPSWGRRVACAVIGLFQLLIAATGNYTFFNWLTIILCVLLLDDVVWPRQWLEAWARWRQGRARSRAWPWWIVVPVCGVLGLASTVPMIGIFRERPLVPAPVVTLYRWLEPFRVVNSYGLFAVMTTSRLEIVLEGSNDGVDWRAYEFTDKPGDLRRPPRFIAPHQPRLDWQMWFAALGSYQHNPWFMRLCESLLRGSPEVLALLAHNPFPTAPPRYLRAVGYDYHFTTFAQRRADGAWWRRERRGLYCPVLSLRDQSSSQNLP